MYRVIGWFEDHLHRTYCLVDVRGREVEWNLSYAEAKRLLSLNSNLKMKAQ